MFIQDLLIPGSSIQLGVMHVATRLYDAIEERYESQLEHYLDCKPKDTNARKLVRMTALLHDVGHAPFSHTGEALMPEKEPGKRFSHEEYSAELIRHEMADVIDGHELNRLEHFVSADELADFYLGRPTKFNAAQFFWRVLVVGQLDADRMDYLLRDSHHCGVTYGHFDLDRIIDTLALVANKSSDLHPDLQIGISQGGRHAAEGMLLARYFMFQQVYFHRVRKAYDHHAERCLSKMLSQGKKNGRLPSPATPHGRKQFLKIDDWTVYEFMKHHRQDRHASAILNHDHDRCVYKTKEIALPSEIERCHELLDKLSKAGLEPWECDADKEWYKVDRGEIQIASESDIHLRAPIGNPLSIESNVISGLEDSKQRLIFVPHNQVKEAKKIIEK